MGAEMTKDEALKLALEALDCICSPLHVREITKVGNAMKAIREALAQPEQEPVAFLTNYKHRLNVRFNPAGITMPKTVDCEIPLYTTPPQRKWVGLTGPEVVEAYRSVSEKEWAIGGLDDARVFFGAIEFKLWEKNT